MTPRTIKEIRTYSPVLVLIAVCGAAIVAVAAVQGMYPMINAQNCLFGIYFIGSLIMAAVTFGNEFHLRTISLLLSQPIERRSLWPEKMRMLALFNAASFIVTFLAYLYIPHSWQRDNYEETVLWCGSMIYVPFLFFCAVPYFTLISRGAVGGIVFTLFAYGMLLAPCEAIWKPLGAAGFGTLKDRLTGGFLDGPSFIFVILSLPCAAFFYWLGRRKFLRMEVIDAQALEANLPAALETPLATFFGKFNSSIAKLLIKELQLQRVSLLLTIAFCIFMAVEFLTWKTDTNRTFVVAGTLIIYALLFPVMACAAAVAEEKAWGIKDWHLTLPPSLKQQWRVKWVVAVTLSLALGGGLTYFLARVGPWYKEFDVNFGPGIASYPLMTVAALYAGSISNSTIRAFLMTFGMIAAYTFILGVLFVALMAMSVGADTPIVPVFVVGILLAELYMWIVWLLWNLIVCPVWWLTHSVEKTRAVAHWADLTTNNHIQVLFLALWVGFFFWLLLHFARANYRHSDFAKRKVFKQLLIILPAIIFLGVAIAGANHAGTGWELPHWTLLPGSVLGH
jgi:hypothetical protein